MALPASVTLVDAGLSERAHASMVAVASFLAAAGLTSTRLQVPAGLPGALSPADRRTWQSFAATPPALVESYRVARHLDTAVPEGRALLLSDHRGQGGVFALEQAMLPEGRRRRVFAVAADSMALEYLAVAGTLGGVDPDDEAVIDWELATYRYAELVLATSERAVAELGELGITARLAVEPAPEVAPADGPIERIRLPEPVSRLAATPTIVRAIAGMAEPIPDVAVSTEDCADQIWNGPTWDSMRGTRAALGARLTRSDTAAPEQVPNEVIVLGDPYALPSAAATAHRDAGGRVVVAAGSAAAARWPTAPTWASADELAAVLRLPISRERASTPSPPLDSSPRRGDPSRAQRVSVGIPVFRDVRFLDACVASVLGQEQAPHEVLIVDDGSQSPAVDAALDRWQSARPEQVRVIRQPNRGVCVARNTALEAMAGDAFVFLDADDVLDPSFIARCADALRARPAALAVATWTEFFGAYEAVEAKPPFDARVGMRENPIVSTAVLVDMQVRELGIRFDPELAFIYCEDWDVWSKIVAVGGEIGLVPAPLARHRVHPDSGGYLRTELALSLGKARATAPLRGL